MKDLPKSYDPKSAENRVYDAWMDGGYFAPVVDPDKKPFVIVMPPPNVTGELHLGHALMAALEDIMVRWHRMLGDPTLYLPGVDHAGIATQVVVERTLATDDITRHDLGRQAFVERVWEWVDKYGGAIDNQLKRLGMSCDWSRRLFTLDEGPNLAVRTTFVNLYKKGLIYEGERINNWCRRCATVLSDLEVVHKDEEGSLYHIRYAIEGGGSVTIATTRPETMLGDTAVAVNPDDERYRDLIGKTAVLPLLGRKLPIIADEAVDREFGTGALKVTPGHDAADFEIGERHGLERVNIMNEDGTLNDVAGHYEGQDRLDARGAVVEQLEHDGLLEKTEPFNHSVGHCQRCDEVLEPLVSRQWYMKMDSLAKPAIEAVEDGRIKIIPEHFAKVYFNWMHNIREWPISRQLWWGHRIPVWRCAGCDKLTVEIEDPTACAHCGSTEITRDPDVLDTWFSSALWPHSTLGWPEDTDDLRYFYPTSVLETGHDILFFWVARMIMMGLQNTGEVPFHTVYLHGIVRDPQGVKMSKTKGNVMDPLDLIDQYGADALRFALTSGVAAGSDMRLNESKMEASRNFANKLWNAARFVLANVDGADVPARWSEPPPAEHLEDRWIVSRLNSVVEQVLGQLTDHQYGEAQRALYDFLWGEYCDWYLEMAKIRLRGEDGPSPVPVLVYVLEKVLRLLHPFMPFITEEVWTSMRDVLPAESEAPPALIVASYPESDEALDDPTAEEEVGAIVEIVRGIRNVRAEFRIDVGQRIGAVVSAPEIAHAVKGESEAIKVLARVDPLSHDGGEPIDSGDRVSLVLAKGTVTVPLQGLVDVAQERERLTGELTDIGGSIQRLAGRLNDERFVSRAPEEVVEKERQRLQDAESRHARITETLKRIEA